VVRLGLRNPRKKKRKKERKSFLLGGLVPVSKNKEENNSSKRVFPAMKHKQNREVWFPYLRTRKKITRQKEFSQP